MHVIFKMSLLNIFLFSDMILESLYTSFCVKYTNTLLKAYSLTHMQFSIHTQLNNCI